METIVRAKMVCSSITQWVGTRGIELVAVVSGSEENKSFSKYTPSGSLKLSIDKATDAYNAFEVGKEYYIDFTKAE